VSKQYALVSIRLRVHFQVENWNSCLQLVADTLNVLNDILYNFLGNFVTLSKQYAF